MTYQDTILEEFENNCEHHDWCRSRQKDFDTEKCDCGHKKQKDFLLSALKGQEETTRKRVAEEIEKAVENLISSKSSDYNKGVQDSVNIINKYK